MTTEECRISIKRLRAEITKVNEARKHGVGIPKHPGPSPTWSIPGGLANPAYEVWRHDLTAHWAAIKATSAERATALYSLRSHLRGTLHITHQYVQEQIPNTYGFTHQVRYERTMDDQTKLVEPLMREFAMTEEERRIDDEERSKRLSRS